jgi:hypothetical protein
MNENDDILSGFSSEFAAQLRSRGQQQVSIWRHGNNKSKNGNLEVFTSPYTAENNPFGLATIKSKNSADDAKRNVLGQIIDGGMIIKFITAAQLRGLPSVLPNGLAVYSIRNQGSYFSFEMPRTFDSVGAIASEPLPTGDGVKLLFNYKLAKKS